MIAAEPGFALVEAPIVMDKPTAQYWASRLCDFIIDGRLTVAAGDVAVRDLEMAGFHDVAATVRNAQFTRARTLQTRGFTSNCWGIR